LEVKGAGHHHPALYFAVHKGKVTMGVQDLWYLKKKPGEQKARPSKRHGRGRRWRVNWEDPDTGEPQTLHFDTEAEAEIKWAEILLSLAKGTYTNPKAGLVTVDDYFKEFYGQLILRDSSRDKIESSYRLHVSPVIGHMTIGQVRSGTLKQWVRSRQTINKPLAASTIRVIYNGTIHPMFAQAVIDDKIPKTPCVGIKLPELPKGEYDLPTAEQVHAIADAIGPRFRAAVMLAAGCGWRSSEVFGAEYDKSKPRKGTVDFLRREVHVRQQVLQPKGGGICLSAPKTRTSYRTTELPTIVAEELARHVELYPPQAVELLDRTNTDKPVTRAVSLLFTDDDGRPMSRAEWSRIWRAAMEKAKLPTGVYTMRSLRHFFVTTLIFGGKNVKTVQVAAGHATPTITLDTYLGYWPDDERHSTRELVNQALGQVHTQSVPKINN
jgi:integrase